jgi:prophage antirepressor-like protein
METFNKKNIWDDKNTIYLSEPGLYLLECKSDKDNTSIFQDFLLSEILYSSVKNKKYELYICGDDEYGQLGLDDIKK